MSSLIQDLENNEAILLMYLSDELPADDCAEVEALLSTDSGMRAELERLREVLGDVEGALGHLDLVEPVSSKRTAALRQVNRAIVQWQIDRLAKAPRPEPAKNAGYPWWVYTASAAAVVVVGLLAWWGFMGDSSPSLQPTGIATNMRNGRGMPFSQDLSQWAGDERISRWMMGVPPTRAGDGGPASEEALDQVERDLVALSAESSNQMTFFGAPHTALEAGSPNE